MALTDADLDRLEAQACAGEHTFAFEVRDLIAEVRRLRGQPSDLRSALMDCADYLEAPESTPAGKYGLLRGLIARLSQDLDAIAETVTP